MLLRYHDLLSEGVFYIGEDDTLYSFIPDFFLLSQELDKGSIPMWTNSIGSGFPLGGYGYNAFLSPILLFFAYFFDGITGIKLLFFTIPILASFSLVRALKLIGVNDLIYHLLAIAGFFFTFFFEALGNYSIKLSFMFAPLVLVLAYKLATDPRRKYLTEFIVISGLTLISFYSPFLVRFFGILYCSLALLILLKEQQKLRKLLFLTIGLIGGLIIASPQIKYTFDLLNASAMDARDSSYFLTDSTFGIWNFFNRFQWDIEGFKSNRNPLTIGWLFGSCSPIIVFLSLFSFYSKERKLVLWLWFLNGIALFCALGKFNPIYTAFVNWGLVFNMRLPSRMLWLINITFPLLSVLGLKELRKIQWKQYKGVLIKYVSVLLVSTISAAFLYEFIRTHTYLKQSYFISRLYEVISSFEIGYFLEKASEIMLSLSFWKRFVVSFSPFVLTTLLFASIYKWGKLRYSIFTVGVLLVIVVEGTAFTNERLKRSNTVHTLEDFKISEKALAGFSKIITIEKYPRDYNGLHAQQNLLYNIPSANLYAEALELKGYQTFLREAVVEAKAGDYSKLKLIGVDGIVTKSKLENTVGNKSINNNWTIFKINERNTKVWFKTDNGLHPVYHAKEEQDGNNTTFTFDLEDGGSVVIGQNKFSAFEVIVDGKPQETDLYYSFYKIDNLKPGKHVVELNFSLFRF